MLLQSTMTNNVIQNTLQCWKGNIHIDVYKMSCSIWLKCKCPFNKEQPAVQEIQARAEYNG